MDAKPLLQDVFVKRSPTAGSCRGTGARSVYEDLLCKMSGSRSPQQDPVGLLAQDLCMRISCAYLCVKISASGSCMTTYARSLYADLLCKISLSGCLPQGGVGPLVQDLCTRISSARSFFQDLCISILRHTISAKGCTSKSENATLPGSTPTISAKGLSFETMLQKYCACQESISRGHTKCCTGHGKASSSSSSKNAIEPIHLKT